MTIKIKHKKVVGILLFAYLIFQITSLLIIEKIESLSTYIRFVPLTILAIGFFIEDRKMHRIAIAVSLFSGCLFDMSSIASLNRGSPISAIIYLIIYGLIGYFIISNKSYEKYCIIITFVFAIVILFIECVNGRILSLILGRQQLNLYISVRGFSENSVFDFIVLITILFDMLNDKNTFENSSQQDVSINKEIINFKDLLLFIENEYKSGKITDEEYKNKRTEILSKI